jgi:uncharacterized membrane protein YfhO
LYTLEALPRFRFEDNSPVDLITLKENPNVLKFSIMNEDHEYLTIADRYDSNWKVFINGEETQIMNAEGMRKVQLQSGENNLEIVFIPIWFYRGLILSATSIFLGLIFAKLRISSHDTQRVINNV